MENFNGYEHNTLLIDDTNDRQKAVVTICSTGKGTAEKLQNLVIDILIDASMNHIKVIPIGIVDMHKRLTEIGHKYQIIAVVGIKNPHIDAPFIPIEQIISGQGDIILREIVGAKDIVKKDETNIVLKRFCEDGLQEMLLYLNPNKIIDILLKFINILEEKLKLTWDNPQKLRLIIHIGCALERMVINNGLKFNEKNIDNIDKEQ